MNLLEISLTLNLMTVLLAIVYFDKRRSERREIVRLVNHLDDLFLATELKECPKNAAPIMYREKKIFEWGRYVRDAVKGKRYRDALVIALRYWLNQLPSAIRALEACEYQAGTDPSAGTRTTGGQ
jgi:hypothetical protein